jgi:hypothetical protein
LAEAPTARRRRTLLYREVADWEDRSPLHMLREAGVDVALWPR